MLAVTSARRPLVAPDFSLDGLFDAAERLGEFSERNHHLPSDG
jgi:hypothetical protein